VAKRKLELEKVKSDVSNLKDKRSELVDKRMKNSTQYKILSGAGTALVEGGKLAGKGIVKGLEYALEDEKPKMKQKRKNNKTKSKKDKNKKRKSRSRTIIIKLD